MPESNRRAQADRPATEDRDAKATVRIHDFGDEVHLWIEQWVSWDVALDILKELKAQSPADDESQGG